VRGNELADEEAKAAVRGKDYRDAVPNLHRKNLPIPLDPDHLHGGMDGKYCEQANKYWTHLAAGAKHAA
jgi:hypothetical protein